MHNFNRKGRFAKICKFFNFFPNLLIVESMNNLDGLFLNISLIIKLVFWGVFSAERLTEWEWDTRWTRVSSRLPISTHPSRLHLVPQPREHTKVCSLLARRTLTPREPHFAHESDTAALWCGAFA